MKKWIVTLLFVGVLIVGAVYFSSWWPGLHDRLTRKDTVDFLTSLGGIAAVLTVFGAMAVWLFRLWRPEKAIKKAEDSPPALPPAPTVHLIHSAASPVERPVALPLHQLPVPPGGGGLGQSRLCLQLCRRAADGH
jgi:hypothetical protein